MSLKKFISHLWEEAKHLFNQLEEETKKLIPIAIHVVELAKTFEDTNVPDVITALIPGTVDDVINAKLRVTIPKVLMELNMIDAIANITDPAEQVKAILARVKLSSKIAQDAFWHNFATLVIVDLSDGHLSWSEAIEIGEMWYKEEYKKTQTP